MKYSITVIGLAIVVAGCSGSRGTKPQPDVVSLPAIPLTADPVLYTSHVVAMQSLPDSDYVANLDSLIQPVGDNTLDIKVSFERRSCREDVSVWNPVDSAWVVIESTTPPVGCIPEVNPGNYLLSHLGLSPRDLLSGTERRLYVNTSRSSWATVQVLGVRSDYKKLTLPRDMHPTALAWNGDLYVSTRNIPSNADSVLVLSPDGGRLGAWPVPFYVNRMAWTPQGLWIMHDYHPAMVTLFDSTGTALGEFSHPADKCGRWASSISAGIVWFENRLLMYDKCDSMLYWVDGMASIEAGEMVVTDSLSFSAEEDTWSIATDGELILFVGPTVRVYSSTGHFVYQLPAPLAYHGAVYDGKALWLTHSGLPSMISSGVVISRFTLD